MRTTLRTSGSCSIAALLALPGLVASCRGHGGAAGDAAHGTDQSNGPDQPSAPDGRAPDASDGTPTMMLYYSGNMRPGRGIGLATSTDGVTFTRHAAGPVFKAGEKGAFDELGVTDPSILLYDGTFYLYYAGKSATDLYQIGLATSKDGVTFARHAASPVIKAGPEPYDQGQASDPSVWLHEGRFVCFYSSETKTGVETTSMATSPDGIVWTKSAASPVIRDGHDPSARRAVVGGGGERWAVYYWRPGGAAVALSDDLTTFTPRPGVLLADVGDVEIVPPSGGPFERFHLFFGGSADGVLGIGVARSSDGVVFERHPPLVLVSSGGGFEADKISDPTVVVVRR